MKKLVFLLLSLSIILVIIPKFFKESNTVDALEVIPDEAIRLRILANSDDEKDQKIKRIVRDEVNESITEWVKDIADIEEARKLIASKTKEIEQIVNSTLQKEGETYNFTVNYDKNVQFPAKVYGNYLYPAGEYEAVLITLGKGEGANWWCVLFPPLCFLDFSSGTTVAEMDDSEVLEDPEEVEVKFFLFEWFGWS